MNLASIGRTAISGLLLPLPSIREQDEIVDIIEERLGSMHDVIDTCESELTRSAALRQSILKNAFAGKLVPQDPADEPASALLARIRAEREAAGGSGRKKRARLRTASKEP